MQRLALLIPFLLAIPLAFFLGIALSTPDTFISLGLLGICLALLALPVVMKWHELFLIFSWSTPIAVFFIPGQLKLWMLMSFLSLCIGVITDGIGGKSEKPSYGRWATAVSVSLIVLTLLVLIVGKLRGGLGSRALGSEVFGGHKYYEMLFAVMGFYALRRVQIPDRQRWIYVGLFFGGTVLLTVSNLIYMAGPKFYWMYSIFPLDYAIGQAAADYGMTSIKRFSGVAFATLGPICYMLARYGIRGVFSIRHPFRCLFVIMLFCLIFVGGFRSLLALAVLIFVIQFFVEGLFNFKTLGIFVAGCAIFYALAVPFAKYLPLEAQRTLSVVPLVQIDPVARADADHSTQWRFRMWDALTAEVPKYLWLGKGYAIDPNLHAIAQMGGGEDFDALMLSGDYHSGPFSVLISFGVPGVLVMILVWWFSIALLHHNYTRGSPELRAINVFLYGYYIARVLFFVIIFGDVAADLSVFCGIVGLSIAVNRSKPESARAESPALESQQPQVAKLEAPKLETA